MKRLAGILAAVFLTINMFGQADTRNSRNALVYSESTHYLGEYYGGGIVFYLDDDGQHGLITAVVDESTRKRSHNRAIADTIDYRGGVAAGRILTADINTSGDAGAEDALENAFLDAEKYSDWYLATRYDLDKLYLNRHVIGGYSDFAKGWKKIEVSAINSWFTSFITGARFSNGKDDAAYVRVVRKF